MAKRRSVGPPRPSFGPVRDDPVEYHGFDNDSSVKLDVSKKQMSVENKSPPESSLNLELALIGERSSEHEAAEQILSR